MATDGPGIIDGDLAHEVYNRILDLYDAGVEVEEIVVRLSEYDGTHIDSMDEEIFLAASAKGLWEIGHLDEARRLRLQELVDQGESLAIWEEEGDEQLAEERRKILTRFLHMISVPRKRPRRRKKYSYDSAKLFGTGYCLQLKQGDRVFRAVVGRVREYRGRRTYYLLVMGPDTGATIDHYIDGLYFGRKIRSGLDPRGYTIGPHVMLLEHNSLIRTENPFTVVGTVDLNEDSFMPGSLSGNTSRESLIEDFERILDQGPAFELELFPLRDLLGRTEAGNAGTVGK